MVALSEIEKKVFIAFWIFGVLNNVLYVVILSALVDLVGALVPKATVLLADVLPAFTIKLVAPFFIHLIPYKYRIFMMVSLDVCGMLIIAFSKSITARLMSIMLVSLSSGGGELTFLQLTHFYNDKALKGFSSGTGGAGLIGSFCYLLMTTWLGISVRNTLLLFCVVPLAFFYIYFVYLPDQEQPFNEIQTEREGNTNTRVIYDEEHAAADHDVEEHNRLLLNDDATSVITDTSASTLLGNNIESNKLLMNQKSFTLLTNHIKITFFKLKPLVIPFMIPLFTVYMCEYIINQGISPTLLFPIETTPFKKYRDMYVVYGTLYQLGVFISRSSSSFIRIRRVYIPSILQLINLCLCILQSMYMIFPSVYILMPLMFYEGLLGGASYVNVFMLVSEKTAIEVREFSMGLVGMSDSAGIVLLATLSMWIEPHLCLYQVDSGRPWCRME